MHTGGGEGSQPPPPVPPETRGKAWPEAPQRDPPGETLHRHIQPKRRGVPPIYRQRAQSPHQQPCLSPVSWGEAFGSVQAEGTRPRLPPPQPPPRCLQEDFFLPAVSSRGCAWCRETQTDTPPNGREDPRPSSCPPTAARPPRGRDARAPSGPRAHLDAAVVHAGRLAPDAAGVAAASAASHLHARWPDQEVGRCGVHLAPRYLVNDRPGLADGRDSFLCRGRALVSVEATPVPADRAPTDPHPRGLQQLWGCGCCSLQCMSLGPRAPSPPQQAAAELEGQWGDPRGRTQPAKGTE